MANIIAIVDDEKKIRDMIRTYLENEGFEVIEGVNGEEAVKIAKEKLADLMLLDVLMPVKDGFETLKEIRAMDQMYPIIMLTAKSEEIDKLLGLEMGADDYITKPFSMRELLARIKTVLRRSRLTQEEEEDELIKRGDLEINVSKFEVKLGSEEIHLTPTEFKILHTLAEKPGRVFSRLQLLHRAMGEAFINYERSIDTHVSNLRKKIEKNPQQPKYIHTVYGIGYRFGEKDER